jgi:hypothetical protein
MAQRQSGFTRASSLGPISEVIERQGGSIARALKAVDLPFALLERHEILVPLREQFDSWRERRATPGTRILGPALARM